MKRAAVIALPEPPLYRVDVVERGQRPRSGRAACIIGRDVKFSTESFESYCLTQWEPVVFDALLVAAAVEFCDKMQRRPVQTWARRFHLRIPVHEPDRWNSVAVAESLHKALELLTGDQWSIDFTARSQPVSVPRQIHFPLPEKECAVIPFSDGLDSRAVAGLAARHWGDGLIRVRLGSKAFDAPSRNQKQPFASIPYQIPLGRQVVESSCRSRGFKFTVMSGIASYLVKARQVIVTESGQGSIGPALVTVGQSYEDYRNHPLFTVRMEQFIAALLGHHVRFEFPQLWRTKGETLSLFVKECADGASWAGTWSCWQGNRQVAVDHKKRQCGICAACMLRRLSVHAAGLEEPKQSYVWEDLRAPTFELGAAARYTITRAQREYAIAGTLHLDHLASIQHSESNKSMLDLTAFQLSQSIALAEAEVRTNLSRMLTQHETEWRNFLQFLGPQSFVTQWAVKP